MEKSLKSSAINYGLYLGLGLAASTIIAYAINLDLLVNMWYGILIFLGIIALGIISVAKSKSLLNGFISFKEAFSSYFLTIFIGLLITTLVSYILFNYIDLEAAETLKQKTIEATITGMERWNMQPDAIAEAVKGIESQNQYSIGNIAKGFGFYTVILSIIGLLVALIMKKNDPDNA